MQAMDALATPTDLKADEVQQVAESLNHLVADAFALYIKTKNFHWHVSGEHFRDYHLLFDEQAASILDSIDVIAERVRKIGGKTLHSVGEVSELQTIQDDDEEFVSAEQMLERLLNDNRQVSSNIRQAAEVAEQNRDLPTANILEEILDETERRIWFLFETMQGENTHSPSSNDAQSSAKRPSARSRKS